MTRWPNGLFPSLIETFLVPKKRNKMLGEPISSLSSSVFELVRDFPPYLKRLLRFPVWHSEIHPGAGGGSAHNGLYGAAPAEKGTVFQASGKWKGREICFLIWNFRRRKTWKGL